MLTRTRKEFKMMMKLKQLVKVQKIAVVAIAMGILSSHAEADSFFDVFVELSNTGQIEMTPADSDGAFPFPPPPLNFPTTIPIEMVSMSLTSSTTQPMVIRPADPVTNTFIIDSFFDVYYEIDAKEPRSGATTSFDAFFDIDISMEVTPTAILLAPDGTETRSWDTEILSMDLSGTHPIELFGDPDFDLTFLAIEGHHDNTDGHVTVLKGPGTPYQIDSFFDIFVEISVDGGATYLPSLEDSQLRLQASVPEPMTMTLLAAGGIAAIRRRSLR